MEEPLLHVSDVKSMTIKDLWEGSMKAEFMRLVDLNAFEFVDVKVEVFAKSVLVRPKVR